MCPSCRRPPTAWAVARDSFVCTNPECGTIHAALPGTGIPLVVRGERESFLQFDSEVRFELRPDAEAWIARLDRGSDMWEQAVRLGMYARMHYATPDSIFTRLYQRFIAPRATGIGSVVDLGCGVGAFAIALSSGLRCPVVGLDSWGLALRVADAVARGNELFVPIVLADASLVLGPLATTEHREEVSVRWVAGDVLDPPLRATSFDLVTAINLFDSVADPALALGQASALLRPGGYMLVAQPDALSAATTRPDRWLPSHGLVWDSLLVEFGLEVVDQDDGFDWTLNRGPRTRFTYLSHATLLRSRS
jgi:SAM-dependent methyltransferase